jgi:hypothetical protein
MTTHQASALVSPGGRDQLGSIRLLLSHRMPEPRKKSAMRHECRALWAVFDATVLLVFPGYAVRADDAEREEQASRSAWRLTSTSTLALNSHRPGWPQQLLDSAPWGER